MRPAVGRRLDRREGALVAVGMISAPSAFSDVRHLHEEYARTRDRSIRDALVEHHARLAHALAARFGPRPGQTADDVLQVAFLALVKAVDGFDPARGFQFSTYATRTILGELKRNVRDNCWMLRPSRSVHDLYLAIESSVDDLAQRLGRLPTIPEIAADVGADVEHVLEAREAGSLRFTRSLDRPVRGQEQPLAEALGGDDVDLARAEQRAALRWLLRRVTDEERLILHLRFVEDMSQRKVADHIGSSQMHVSRVLARLRTRLRVAMAERP